MFFKSKPSPPRRVPGDDIDVEQLADKCRKVIVELKRSQAKDVFQKFARFNVVKNLSKRDIQFLVRRLQVGDIRFQSESDQLKLKYYSAILDLPSKGGSIPIEEWWIGTIRFGENDFSVFAREMMKDRNLHHLAGIWYLQNSTAQTIVVNDPEMGEVHGRLSMVRIYLKAKMQGDDENKAGNDLSAMRISDKRDCYIIVRNCFRGFMHLFDSKVNILSETFDETKERFPKREEVLTRKFIDEPVDDREPVFKPK